MRSGNCKVKHFEPYLKIADVNYLKKYIDSLILKIMFSNFE